jgi:hypothetical protein
MSLTEQCNDDKFNQVSLAHAAKLALEVDKALHFDYFLQSFKGECKIVKTPEEDKILFKSQDEYTSPLIRLLRIPSLNGTNEFLLCETQNSLYIVHANMLKN